jgi:hypothetical protein
MVAICREPSLCLSSAYFKTEAATSSAVTVLSGSLATSSVAAGEPPFPAPDLKWVFSFRLNEDLIFSWSKGTLGLDANLISGSCKTFGFGCADVKPETIVSSFVSNSSFFFPHRPMR